MVWIIYIITLISSLDNNSLFTDRIFNFFFSTKGILNFYFYMFLLFCADFILQSVATWRFNSYSHECLGWYSFTSLSYACSFFLFCLFRLKEVYGSWFRIMMEYSVTSWVFQLFHCLWVLCFYSSVCIYTQYNIRR